MRGEELDERILSAREGWRARRWRVGRPALVDPHPPAVRAARCGLAPQAVSTLLWAEKQRGPAGVAPPGRGSGSARS
ncbi:MAG TPA: hypothetical protein VKJ47_12595 [Candidatus Binatia bacterium]|nr:hypothetical protein [Candidatus Binatia bacterium]